MQLNFFNSAFYSCCSGIVILSNIAIRFNVCGIPPPHMSLSHSNSTESQQCDHCSSNLTRKEKPQPEGPEALGKQSLVF